MSTATMDATTWTNVGLIIALVLLTAALIWAFSGTNFDTIVGTAPEGAIPGQPDSPVAHDQAVADATV